MNYVYIKRTSNSILTNIEAFAHIIDLANRTTDKATYEYLMREAQEIMRDKKTRDIDYCDFRHLVNERLVSQTIRAKKPDCNRIEDVESQS